MGPSVKINSLNGKFEGAYRVAAVSGLYTGVAAGSSTAGHLFAMRWSPSTAGTNKPAFCLVQRIRARMTTIAGFTSAQEAGIDLIVARAYTASHTGATALTLTGNNAKKKTSFPTTLMASMRVADTGALTAGTHTLDAQPIAEAVYSELAAAATVQKGSAEILLTDQDLDHCPIVLAADEGLIVRNTIAQGTGGTARLVVEVDWLEVQRY